MNASPGWPAAAAPGSDAAAPAGATTGNSRLRYLPLTEVSTADLLSFLRLSLGDQPEVRNEAFWTWKHVQNPFGPSPGLAAVAKGQVVALRVFLRWAFADRSRLLPAVRAVDTATHPSWRRQGLFRQLTQRLVHEVQGEGTALIFNTPNPRSRRGYLAMGWQDMGRVPLLVRVLRPGRVAAALLAGRARQARQAHSLDALATIDELLDVPGLAPFLARLWSDEPRLHTPRSLEYLRWRYAAVPSVRYGAQWRLAGGSGALVIARARQRRGLSEVSLAEILVPADGAGIEQAIALLDTIVASVDADYIVASAAPGTPEERAARGAGFRPVRWLGPRLTARWLAEEGKTSAASWSGWRLSFGDLELF